MQLTQYRKLPYPVNLWSTLFQREIPEEAIPPCWEEIFQKQLASTEGPDKFEMLTDYYKNNLITTEIGVKYNLSGAAALTQIHHALATLRASMRKGTMEEYWRCVASEKTDCAPCEMLHLRIRNQDRANIHTISVAALNIGGRAYNGLRRKGISTIGELTHASGQELLASHVVGQIGLQEIKYSLAQYGLKLQPDDQTENQK